MESARCSLQMRRHAAAIARAEPERIPLEVVAVEDRPRPADDRVGVDVRRVVEAVLAHQPVPQLDDRVEVVDAEGVGRPHRRHQRHDAAALLDHVAGGGLQPVDADVVGQVRRRLDDVLLAEPQPARDVQAAVVALRRRQDRAVGADAVVHRVGERLLDPEPGAVERRAGPAEGEDAGRPVRVVADEPGGHRGDLRLGHRHAERRLVRDEVRVVDGGQQRPDDARDRRRRDDVDLRPRVPPDRQSLQPVHQHLRHRFHAAPLLGERRLPGRVVVERARPAEQRHLRLHRVDPVERPHDREDEVRVVLPVGDRRGKRVAHAGQAFVIERFSHGAILPARAGSRRRGVRRTVLRSAAAWRSAVAT